MASHATLIPIGYISGPEEFKKKTKMNLYYKTSIQFQSCTEAIVECNVSGYNSRTGFRKPSSSSLEKEKRFQTTEQIHFGPPYAIIVQQQLWKCNIDRSS